MSASTNPIARRRRELNGDARAEPVMRRLARAAVRMADIFDLPPGPDDAIASDEFMAADEELREASLAYARSLSPTVRKAAAL